MKGIIISLNVLFLGMAIIGFVKEGLTFSSTLFGIFMLTGAVICTAIYLKGKDEDTTS